MTMTRPPQTTAALVRAAREAAGLTQAALAERAHYGPPQISQIERGVREPSLPVLRRLARVLRVEPGDLIGE